jgi:hypothetical protein
MEVPVPQARTNPFVPGRLPFDRLPGFPFASHEGYFADAIAAKQAGHLAPKR